MVAFRLQKIRSTLVAQETKILRARSFPSSRPPARGTSTSCPERTARTARRCERMSSSISKAIMPVRENYSKNVGLWTERGLDSLDEVAHMWVYRDLNERASVRTKLKEDREWQAFLAKGNPLLLEMTSVVLSPTPNSAMK